MSDIQLDHTFLYKRSYETNLQFERISVKSLGSKVQTKMETFSLRVTIDKKSHKRDHILTRGGVENTRLKPNTQKKSEAKAKDSPSEERPSRGQGQECSKPRPRTEDPGASILLKKGL